MTWPLGFITMAKGKQLFFFLADCRGHCSRRQRIHLVSRTRTLVDRRRDGLLRFLCIFTFMITTRRRHLSRFHWSPATPGRWLSSLQ